MHHIAIMDRKRKLLDKILSGEKRIESRWYKTRRTPYNNIKAGDTIYFKDSAEPITAVAKVEKVMFFDSLDRAKIVDILRRYGKQICIPESDAPKLDGKSYCTLIWLKDVKRIVPFSIDKTGFGNACAWITIDDVSKLRL